MHLRRPWKSGETLFLLGPGGVAKSTLGRTLGAQLGWPVIDLDLVFCDQLGLIGEYITRFGYEHYRAQNLALARKLVSAIETPTIFVTASGFLAAPPGSDDYLRARKLVAKGYGITLLPSLDVEAATATVVARQLARGFGLEQASEDRKFRERFSKYRDEGEALVISTEAPEIIAAAIIRELTLS
jgi:shikimate kinase